jgi:hypothetical protein
MNAIGKGQTKVLSIITGGYISGSGNYLEFFVPCNIDSSVTVASMTNLSTIVVYTQSRAYTSGSFDASYNLFEVVSAKNGIKCELKFNETQTTNTPCVVSAQMSVAFS